MLGLEGFPGDERILDDLRVAEKEAPD